MATTELIPDILEKKQFPIGDVDDRYKEKKVDEWFRDNQDDDREKFLSRIKIYCLPTESGNAIQTHKAAIALCEDWDNANGNRLPYAHMGYRLFIAFNRKTQYLPNCTMDLTEDLTQMRLPEDWGGKLNSSREFGRRAWESIESYQKVHGTYQRLVDIAIKMYGLKRDEEIEDFKTGMSLPFTFAWISRMHGYREILPTWLTRPGVEE